MATFSDHDLQHVARRRTLKAYVADRARKSSFMVAMDRRYAGVGVAAHESGIVVRIRAQSSQVE